MKYRCPHCKKIVDRKDTRAWITSWCTDFDQSVRLQRCEEKNEKGTVKNKVGTVKRPY